MTIAHSSPAVGNSLVSGAIPYDLSVAPRAPNDSHAAPGVSDAPDAPNKSTKLAAPSAPIAPEALTTSDTLAAPDSLAALDVPALGSNSPLGRLRTIGRLPNHLVLSELLQMNRREHRLQADVLLYLSELDRRGLYREYAVCSAFDFCVKHLGYSEDVAYKRVGAARLMHRYPTIYGLLIERRIHLTALMLIKPHLTEENHEDWLSSVCGMSKRQVERLLAARCPRPDLPARIRKMPERGLAVACAAQSNRTEDDPTPDVPPIAFLGSSEKTIAGLTTTTSAARTPSSAPDANAPKTPTILTSTSAAATTQETPTTSKSAGATKQESQERKAGATTTIVAAPPVSHRPRVEPLSASTYRVTFTASERLKEKLERARELLSHCISYSDLPAIIERALDQIIAHEEKRRYGAPHTNASTAASRRGHGPIGANRCRAKSSYANCRGRVSPNNDHCTIASSGAERTTADTCDQRRASAGSARVNVSRPTPVPSVDPDPNRAGSSPATTSAPSSIAALVPAPSHSRSSPEFDSVPDHFGLSPALVPNPNHFEARSDAIAGSVETAKPGSGAEVPTRSHRRRKPSAAVRRAVFDRDGGQCTFVDSRGQRCTRRHYVEFDHIEPSAVGGTEAVENLRLLCKWHNRLEAERFFGRELAKSAVASARSRSSRRRESD